MPTTKDTGTEAEAKEAEAEKSPGIGTELGRQEVTGKGGNTPRTMPAGDWTNAAAPVYRTGPSAASGTTTLPAVGAVAANDVWLESYAGGANPAGGAAPGTPTYILMAKQGIAYFPPD